MKKLLIICGATATGKTALAVDCAIKLKSEVISADSQLVYRGLDIGTAKPTAEERRGVKHHMIDVADPRCDYSVFDYESAASPIVRSLLSRNMTPIICGGTGFYINSLIYDLSYGNSGADAAIRKKYAEILESRGREYLYSLLKEADPKTAEVLHVNDVKRVIRALEIFEMSGIKKSEQNDVMQPKYGYAAIAIDYPREELYKRIDRRVEEMFARGLVGEVKSLLKLGIDENCRCMQAIGYKEVVKCLKNGDNESTMCDKIKTNTRHYAKRQITFFKKLPNIVWLEPCNARAEYVTELVK